MRVDDDGRHLGGMVVVVVVAAVEVDVEVEPEMEVHGFGEVDIPRHIPSNTLAPRIIRPVPLLPQVKPYEF